MLRQLTIPLYPGVCTIRRATVTILVHCNLSAVIQHCTVTHSAFVLRLRKCEHVELDIKYFSHSHLDISSTCFCMRYYQLVDAFALCWSLTITARMLTLIRQSTTTKFLQKKIVTPLYCWCTAGVPAVYRRSIIASIKFASIKHNLKSLSRDT